MKRKFFAYPYIVWMILFIIVPMFFIFYYAFKAGWAYSGALSVSGGALKADILSMDGRTNADVDGRFVWRVEKQENGSYTVFNEENGVYCSMGEDGALALSGDAKGSFELIEKDAAEGKFVIKAAGDLKKSVIGIKKDGLSLLKKEGTGFAKLYRFNESSGRFELVTALKDITDGNYVISFFGGSKFWDTITNPLNWKVLWRSVVISLKTTAICLLLGYPIAYILSNMKKSVAGFISVLFFVPMWMNFVLRTYAWKSILEYMIPSLGAFLGTEGSVLMVLVYDFLPFMVLPLYNTLAKLDKSLIEASRDLGANGPTTFFRVVLPLSVPGIVSGVTMVFIPAITAFSVPELIGKGKYQLYGNIIETAFKTNSSQGDYAVGSTLSIILLISVLVSTVIMNHFDKDQQQGGQMW